MLTIEKKKVIKTIEVEEEVCTLTLTKNQLFALHLILGRVANNGPIREDINAIWNVLEKDDRIDYNREHDYFKTCNSLIFLKDGASFK